MGDVPPCGLHDRLASLDGSSWGAEVGAARSPPRVLNKWRDTTNVDVARLVPVKPPPSAVEGAGGLFLPDQPYRGSLT